MTADPEYPTYRTAIPGCDKLGESPHWDGSSRTLTRVDFIEGTIHRWNAASGDETVDTGRAVASFAIPGRDGLVYGSGSEVVTRTASGEGVLARLDGPATINDAACDARGRLWFGTYAASGDPVADLHCLSADGLQRANLRLRGPNGLGWSPDSAELYLVESQQQVLLAFDFDLDAGRINGHGRVLHDFNDLPGMPDGLAVDANGGIWVAVAGASRLLCITPQGSLLRDARLPVSRPTNLVFTGDGEALVTTATHRLTDEERDAQPLAGSVLGLDLGVSGAATAPIADL